MGPEDFDHFTLSFRLRGPALFSPPPPSSSSRGVGRICLSRGDAEEKEIHEKVEGAGDIERFANKARSVTGCMLIRFENSTT
ncbi:hypothetical protein CDAR_495571 [Caerostris darwini]|uniref:Uncharacterized protein n=1 Tax=Caerostris darwini TaxID=1538125 RepID=A0AAV4SA65_9ARAC|nr:hypothetical protein CDAR_495571 [Caerostris darwini]